MRPSLKVVESVCHALVAKPFSYGHSQCLTLIWHTKPSETRT